MARLLPGENAKIDNINRLVDLSREGDSDAMGELLRIFHPMILKLCKKWSDHFHDEKHTVKPWDTLVADAQYWFIEYTRGKYIVDGKATYNNFIKNHISQRVRYIYECELKYMKQHIFPDPDKRSTHEGEDADDMFDDVVRNYGILSCDDTDMADRLIAEEDDDKKVCMCNVILSRMDDPQYFTVRERKIFLDCIRDGKTHEDVGRELGISRTRVSQIVGKIKKKIYDILDDNVKEWWER